MDFAEIAEQRMVSVFEQEATAMVVFLRLNGRRLEATADEAEPAIRQVASGVLDRAGLQDWVQAHEVPA
jgi:prophage maintenance system killer protein